MAQALTDFGTGTASNIAGGIIVPVIRQVVQGINDVRRLEENRELLGEQLNRVEGIVLHIDGLFRDQQRQVPDSLNARLLRVQSEVGKGRELIHRSERPWRIYDLLTFKPVSTQLREWNTTINGLVNELTNEFSLINIAHQVVSTARQQEDVLLQPLPDTGLIGMDINEAEEQLQSCVSEDPRVRIICVNGMGGVGKTTLLQKVHNTYKRDIQIFDHVIWVTVAQFPILQMQNDVASAIHLDLANCSADMRKMKLLAYLKNKKFFLILDDMWSALDLKELGVEFGNNNQGSKIVFTTRNKELIHEMDADKSIPLQPLHPEEAWELFCKITFTDGHVPEGMGVTARLVSEECQGLPLAIKVIASTMRGNTDVDDWELALKQMQIVDPNFPHTHPRIDKELYQKLRWSYDRLPTTELKNCFLHCAMYPEDTRIQVKYLVQRWIAEGLLKTREDEDYEYLLKTGHNYVKILKQRCLLTDSWHYYGGDDWDSHEDEHEDEDGAEAEDEDGDDNGDWNGNEDEAEDEDGDDNGDWNGNEDEAEAEDTDGDGDGDGEHNDGDGYGYGDGDGNGYGDFYPYRYGDDEDYISVHDVLHDMAIYIGESGENCVFRAGKGLQQFPYIPDPDKCKRISVEDNLIRSLPAKELKCPKLVSLFLGQNHRLEEIPGAFLRGFTSLRVLDFQGLPIRSLPTSLWQLTQLESLSLHGTKIAHIPEEIGNLSNLQFLHLRGCNIASLPSQIGELKNLKYLSTGYRVTRDEIAELSEKLPKCEMVR